LLEQGNHRVLIQKSGRYAHYWNLQIQGAEV
jgi:ABC-type transport system involved in Fe-S cluster assembly fused permease/ATPase subunit